MTHHAYLIQFWWSPKIVKMLRLANPRNFAILQKTFAVATQQVTALNYKAITPIVSNQQWRSFSITSRALCESDPNAEDEAEEEETNEDDPNNENSALYKKINRLWSKYRGTDRDRSRIISPEESIRYIKSSAFKLTYGDKLPWELYRRIHKGQFPKARTRRSCIRHNVIAVGSPCPVCRDEYLVLHHTNVDLLQMFVSPHTGKVALISYFMQNELINDV